MAVRDSHTVVDVKYINPEPMGRSSVGRLETVLNAICFPKGNVSFNVTQKTYTYSTDIELEADDIVLVDTSGSVSVAVVDRVYESTFLGKKVLAKLSFSKSIEVDRSKIIEEIILNLNKEELERFALRAAEDSSSEKIKKLIRDYHALDNPLSRIIK